MTIVILGVVVLVFSAILHEIMHGVVANRLGDPTARIMGRLTLNPLPHIDPVMSVIVPFLLIFLHSPIVFGAAKPVPVNPHNLHDGKKDFALVALAGPLTNLCIAVIAAALAHIFVASNILANFFALVVFYNLVLTFINLIPIPPLDGSRVFNFLLPAELSSLYMSLEPFGFFILIMLFLFPFGGFDLGGAISNLVSYSMHLLGL